MTALVRGHWLWIRRSLQEVPVIVVGISRVVGVGIVCGRCVGIVIRAALVHRRSAFNFFNLVDKVVKFARSLCIVAMLRCIMRIVIIVHLCRVVSVRARSDVCYARDELFDLAATNN